MALILIKKTKAMKNILCIGILLSTTTILAYSQTHQQLYRWTDSKGVVHYTEYAPDETRQQILNIDPINPPQEITEKDVEKMDIFRPSPAFLVEVPQKKPFNPKDRQPEGINTKIVADLLDPKALDYCQTIQENLKAFSALEKGEYDQLLLVSQSGDQSRLSQKDLQEKYKTTIDNLEKYCLKK